MPGAEAASRATSPIVMDGNGRWASAATVRAASATAPAQARCAKCIEAFCVERGIEALTLFAFSSENWKRPEEEVGALMRLFLHALDREVDELHGHGVRMRFIGDPAASTSRLRERMQAAEASHRRQRRGCTLNIAVSYGGRWDIVQAAPAGGRAVVARRAAREDIDETRLGQRDEPGGSAAAGPVHPHRRRAPHQQLPALAARVHRTVVHRNLVARFRPG